MKSTVGSIFISFVLIIFAIFYAGENSESIVIVPENNVLVVNGIQIVELRAKGGYQPRRSFAQAGVKTTLRIDTNGTFDCSAAIRIPSLSYNKILPQTGTTDIDLGIQKPGIFRGSCGMGMYPFEIEFK